MKAVKEGDDKGQDVGWHHRFKGPEFEQAPGDGEGQGSLAYYYPWGIKELGMTEQLNNNNNKDMDMNKIFREMLDK